MENILHITTRSDWERALKAGSYTADSLAREGFIHGSFRSQVVDVANRFFRGRQDLVLLEADPRRLTSPVKLEDILNEGKLFPHIYGPIPVDAVVRVHVFGCGPDGTFALPAPCLEG